MAITAINEMDADLISQLRQYSRQLVREWGYMSPTSAGTPYTASVTHALIEISLHEGLMSADLCGPLNLDKSSISRIVKKLVDAGEIEETFDGGAAGKGDGRVKRLILTSKGRETIIGINEFGNHQVSTALSKLPPDSHPSTTLTGIRDYANALLSHRLSLSTPTPNPNPTTQLTSPPPLPATPLDPPIQIVSGYQPSLISTTIALQLSFYGPTHKFGPKFESVLALAMGDLVPRLDGLNNEVWCAMHSIPNPNLNPNPTTTQSNPTNSKEIIGCIWISSSPYPLSYSTPPAPGTRRAQLRFFIVSSKFQRRGIGRMLVEKAVRFCDERGFEECELSTFEGLRGARKLYERVGFRDVGERRHSPWDDREILQQFMIRKRGGV